MRNTIIFTAVLFIAVVIASVFYFRNLDKEQNQAARPLKYLPDNTLLIASIHNNEISDNIFKDFEVFDALLGKSEVELLGQFRNRILRDEEISPFVQDADIYISFHPSEEGTETLITIPTTIAIEDSQFQQLLQNVSTKYEVSTADTLGHRIYNLAYGQGDSVWHVLHYENIFFASRYDQLLIDIVGDRRRHLPDEQIDFFLKNSSRNTPLSIYYPHQQYDSIVNLYQRRDRGPFLEQFKKMQGQSAWNINFKQDALMLTGESELDEYSENYVSLFKNQQKRQQSLYHLFPANTAAYMEYTVSDRSKFQKDLKDLFKRRKEDIAQEIDTTQSSRQLNRVLGDEFAFIETENQNYIAFVRMKDTTVWRDFQSGYLEDTSDSIYRFKNSEILYKQLGDPFKYLSRPHLIRVGDVLVFANASSTLRAYLQDWSDRNLLTNTLGFKNFEKLQSDEANVTFFVHTKNAQQKIINSLTQPFRDNFEDTENFGFQDFYSWSVQLSGNEGNLSSQIYAVYKSKSALGVTPEWTYEFENSAITQPYVFEHSDTSTCILIQELDHTMHAIHPSGQKMWSALFFGRVVGDMQQLEDRSIVLVTDRNMLYRFDSNGKTLPGFSLTLPDEPVATPTVSTIRDQKIILVPGRHAVYAYDMNGNRYGGWQQAEIQGNIIGPVLALQDHLVVATDRGWVYFLDQQGHEVHIAKAAGDAGFRNPLAGYEGKVFVTDTTGVLHRFGADGSDDAFRLAEHIPDHFSDFMNINATSAPELILLDGGHLKVYDVADSARLLFEHNFTKDITTRPQYFKSVDSKGQYQLGVASKATNLLYLFESNGNVIDGFPVEGRPQFYYGHIRYNGDVYLLTMRRDHRLYAFRHQKE